jgi:hypothetical protein
VKTFLAGILLMVALGGVSFLVYDRLAIGAVEQFGFESVHVGNPPADGALAPSH